MNVVVLIGNLTSDVKMSDNGVASFRLAVSKDSAEGGADFIGCKAFGKTAANLARFKGKGDEIALLGRISTGSYTNREGKIVYTEDVIANKIDFTRGSKGEKTEQKSYGATDDIRSLMSGDLPDSFDQLDEDVPF